MAQKDYGNTYHSIKSRAQIVVSLKDRLKKRCNLKGSLLFCNYRLPDRLKYFYSGSAHKEWKDS